VAVYAGVYGPTGEPAALAPDPPGVLVGVRGLGDRAVGVPARLGRWLRASDRRGPLALLALPRRSCRSSSMKASVAAERLRCASARAHA
jgi:hypothetical protein